MSKHNWSCQGILGWDWGGTLKGYSLISWCDEPYVILYYYDVFFCHHWQVLLSTLQLASLRGSKFMNLIRATLRALAYICSVKSIGASCLKHRSTSWIWKWRQATGCLSCKHILVGYRRIFRGANPQTQRIKKLKQASHIICEWDGLVVACGCMWLHILWALSGSNSLILLESLSNIISGSGCRSTVAARAFMAFWV